MTIISTLLVFFLPHPTKSKIDNLKKKKKQKKPLSLYYNEFGHALFQSIFPHLQSSLQHWSVTTLVTVGVLALISIINEW